MQLKQSYLVNGVKDTSFQYVLNFHMHWLSLAPTSAGVCDIISVAWWKGTRAGVSACFECLLWCWSECRHTDGEGKTSLKLPSLPKSLPSCQIQCCVKVPGPVAGSKKICPCWKDPEKKHEHEACSSNENITCVNRLGFLLWLRTFVTFFCLSLLTLVLLIPLTPLRQQLCLLY